MKPTRKIAALLGVAAVAFIAGRASLEIAAPSAALAAQSPSKKETQPPAATKKPTTPPSAAPEMDPEMMAKMEAWMKSSMPGDHHKVLQAFVGKFQGEVSMRMEPDGEPMKATGTVTREWVLDNRFVTEHVDGASDMGEYHGMGCMGYNNFDGQYEFAFIDSHSTAIHFGTGTYDPAKKQLLTRGSMRDPASGHVVTMRGVVDISNPDRHTFAEYTYDDKGREFKTFEGVFDRVKE